MGQDSHIAFALLSRFAPRSEERSQSPLVLGEGALDLPALAEGVTREAPFHFAPEAAPGPFARAARLNRNDRVPDAQSLPAKPVMRLAVVGGVRQDAGPSDRHAPFAHHGREVRRVVRRANPHTRRGPKVASSVAQHGQLRPPIAQRLPALRLLRAIITAHIAALEPGGVNNPLGARVDQAQKSRSLDGAPLEYVKSPFFSSRASAF